MTVDSPGGLTVVFTATVDGFHTLALEINGSQTLKNNATALTNFNTNGNGYLVRETYLLTGDEISYQGDEAELLIGYQAPMPLP